MNTEDRIELAEKIISQIKEIERNINLLDSEVILDFKQGSKLEDLSVSYVQAKVRRVVQDYLEGQAS